MIHVAICEDQTLMLKGLGSLLDSYDDVTVSGLYENGQLLLSDLKEGRTVPDVILMDVEMPLLNGLETTGSVRYKYPDVKVLMLSTHVGPSYIENAIRNGAHGYLSKETEPDAIYDAVKEVYRNGFFFNDMISFTTLQEYIRDGSIRPKFTEAQSLSRREVQVVRCICREMTTQEIAKELNLGENTVNSYRQNIMTKIGTNKSIGIVIYALKNGIFIP